MREDFAEDGEPVKVTVALPSSCPTTFKARLDALDALFALHATSSQGMQEESDCSCTNDSRLAGAIFLKALSLHREAWIGADEVLGNSDGGAVGSGGSYGVRGNGSSGSCGGDHIVDDDGDDGDGIEIYRNGGDVDENGGGGDCGYDGNDDEGESGGGIDTTFGGGRCSMVGGNDVTVSGGSDVAGGAPSNGAARNRWIRFKLARGGSRLLSNCIGLAIAILCDSWQPLFSQGCQDSPAYLLPIEAALKDAANFSDDDLKTAAARLSRAIREVTSSSAHALVSFAVAASLALLDSKNWCQDDREQLRTLLNTTKCVRHPDDIGTQHLPFV
jgi:hypothetical protein